jgi:predicted porin
MKKALLATTALAVAGVSSNAIAVDVELYGQVNKALMLFDDGVNTDFSVTDNDRSSTRFGLKGSQALDNGLTASVLLEMEVQDNPSNGDLQDGVLNTDAQSSEVKDGSQANPETRHARVGLAGDWGAVFLGRQSTASDSVTEQDMAGVTDLMASDVRDIGGGIRVRTKTANTFLNNTTLGTTSTPGSAATVYDFTNNMDGNGRKNSVRYDSPIFNGFQGRISYANGGDIDLAAYYNGKWEEFMIKAAVGYVAFNDLATDTPSSAASTDDLESQISGSVTVKHDSGIAGTLAIGERSLENKSTGVEDPSFYYAKLGYEWDAFQVAVDYGQWEDTFNPVGTANFSATDQTMDVMGIGGQYNMGHGVSLAAMYRNFDADITGVETEQIDIYALSLRAKF